MAHRDSILRPWLAWVLLIPLALATAIWALPRLVHPVRAEEKETETKPQAVALTMADLYVVTSHAIPETVQATGTLEPLPGGRATISAELPGRLLNLTLKPGDRVELGEVVAHVLRSDL